MLSINAWGVDPTTLYIEAFGDNGGSTTAISSYSNYTATQAMFSDGTATVKSHYSGSGSIGKSTYSTPNISTGYTGASGASGIYHAGTANTEATIITISGIKIKDYESLQLSFGALGGSTTHVVTATYQIDGGTTNALSLTNSTLSNKSWTLVSGNISGTGSSLTISIKHKPTKSWTIRLDDIKVTGVAASSTYTVLFSELLLRYFPAINVTV